MVYAPLLRRSCGLSSSSLPPYPPWMLIPFLVVFFPKDVCPRYLLLFMILLCTQHPERENRRWFDFFFVDFLQGTFLSTFGKPRRRRRRYPFALSVIPPGEPSWSPTSKSASPSFPAEARDFLTRAWTCDEKFVFFSSSVLLPSHFPPQLVSPLFSRPHAAATCRRSFPRFWESLSLLIISSLRFLLGMAWFGAPYCGVYNTE